MELLFLIAVGFAFKSAFDHVRTTRKASEGARLKEFAKTFRKGEIPKRKLKSAANRHALGWWLSEAGHGFPVARRGWQAGWIAHRTEAEHHRARLEEAKTTHADVQASVLAGLPDHRARQAEARKRRDEILERLKGQPEEAKGSRKAVQEAADEVAAKRAEKQAAATPPLPSETVDQKAAPGPYAPRGLVHHDHTLVLPGQCPDRGGPGPGIPLVRGDRVGEVREQDGTLVAQDAVVLSNDGKRVLLQAPDGRQIDAPAALPLPGPYAPAPEMSPAFAEMVRQNPDLGGEDFRRLRELRDSGYDGWVDQDGNPAPDEMTDPSRTPQPIPPSDEAPPTGGDTMSADTTYDSAVAQAKALAASADEDLATIRKRQEELSATSDAMQAVDVDPATLSDLMDLLDRYKALEQEAQACGEGAQSIADGLAKRHGNLNEAHQNAPVRAANRDFYEG